MSDTLRDRIIAAMTTCATDNPDWMLADLADAVIKELGLHQESDGFHGPAARTRTRQITPWRWDDTGEIATEVVATLTTCEDSSSLLAWGEEQLRLRHEMADAVIAELGLTRESARDGIAPVDDPPVGQHRYVTEWTDNE